PVRRSTFQVLRSALSVRRSEFGLARARCGTLNFEQRMRNSRTSNFEHRTVPPSSYTPAVGFIFALPVLVFMWQVVGAATPFRPMPGQRGASFLAQLISLAFVGLFYRRDDIEL